MKILVTGSNGQLGNELKALSQQLNETFYFTDKEELNIADEPSVKNYIADIQPDFIINCAAYTAVDKAETDTEMAYLINAKAIKNIAHGCAVNQVKLIHISTDFVFDGLNNKPYKENEATNPLSVYGKSKLQGEQLCLEYCPNAIIIRTSWLYSSFGNNFVKTMLKLGSERPELRVIYDQTGTPTYAADLAQSILKIINHPQVQNTNGIFHYSNHGVCSWYDFAKEIMALSGKNCQVKPIETFEYPTPATRPHYSVLNKRKIAETFDLDIPYWKDSLTKCLALLNS